MRNNGSKVSRDLAIAPGEGEPLDQYRRLIEGLSDYAIIALAVDGSIVSWNAGAQQIFGYEPHEILGQPYAMIFTADAVAKGQPQAELRAASTLGKAAVDGWHVRKDGTQLWCTDTVQRTCDAGGALTGFTKIVRDSTEYHAAAQSLRESEERLRLLIESVTEYAIFSIDDDGAVLLWNPGAELIFGYGEADILGANFGIIYPAETIARGVPAAEIAKAARDGRVLTESWHVRRGGERFFASLQITRLKARADGVSRGFVVIAHDITVRNQVDETIKRQAFYDELTRLPNRAFFSDYLRRAIAHAKRHPDGRFAVIFLDLDRFKNINDSLGHGTADELLVHVARTLQRCVRPEDIVARLGGDEFTILLSEIHNVADATHVAARIQAALQIPIVLDGFEICATASMGIAVGSATYDNAEQVLRDADTAMYEAKSRGRARHVLFDDDMHSRAVGLLDLQMALRRAIVRQEFYLDYQPIVALEHGRLIGFEALVRWNHPERGPLTPGTFLSEAEDLGLVIQIDRWVLHEACRQLRAWQIRYDDPTLSVSVNLSSKHFANEHLVRDVREVLASNDLAPGSLKLEITETVLMENVEITAATIRRVGELGVELYIDDFGTGYSSLSYLMRLPLKLLKVDRSFVSQISSNERSVEIARTIVTLAHNLGLTALAEGIESAEQLAKLRSIGCEFGQGFWFSPPVSPADAQRLVGHRLPRPALASV
ncbi:MAG: EAL domain-containing protein [Vulcanimicrobiaceae bacterium]